MNATSNNSGTKIFKNFKAMGQAMEGENTTNEWDIICSYDLTKVNQMLSERFKQGKLVASIPNISYWNWVLDFDGLNVNYYNFGLQSPILQFNLDGRATLNIPIAKISKMVQGYIVTRDGTVSAPSTYQPKTWYSKEGDTFIAIADQSQPAVGDCAIHDGNWYKIAIIKNPSSKEVQTGNHSLIGSIPIAAITGNNQVYNKGTIVVFNAANSNKDAHIVLHFSNKATNPATFSISPKLDDDFNQEASLLDGIKNYFSNSVNEIDYVLNTVSAKPNPSGDTVITPKSFVFATESTGGSTGVLSTYIETNQNRGQGQSAPVFMVQGERYSPIPEGNSASIIFSQDFIQNILIRNPLESNLAKCSVSFNNVDSGIQASIYSNEIKVDVNIGKTLTGGSSESGGGVIVSTYYYVKVDNDVLSSQDYPITLQITQNTASLAWNINNAGFNYETGVQTQSGFYTSPIEWSTDRGHKITIGITSNPNTSSILSLDSKDNINIHPNLGFDQSTYTAHVTPQPHESCWEKFWGGEVTEDIHNTLQSAASNLAPKISLKFPGLNYFATTNILFPGANIFEVDTTTGVRVPRDLVILGNINS